MTVEVKIDERCDENHPYTPSAESNLPENTTLNFQEKDIIRAVVCGEISKGA